jgi:cell division transport system ATP-binding protein
VIAFSFRLFAGFAVSRAWVQPHPVSAPVSVDSQPRRALNLEPRFPTPRPSPAVPSSSPQPRDGATLPTVIETYHLTKLYKRGVPALRDLTITIDKGEFLFLAGPSGAGKSTLLRLLLREELPSDGELRVDGRSLRDLSRSEVQAYRRSIGFVFQDFRLIPRMSVFQNVAFVMRVLGVPIATQEKKTYQVLKWVGLQHRLHAMPEELSGGEQQRVAIARALVNDPQLVLADEPTGNLDPDLSLEIMNLFREVNARGTTVIVATHDRELIRQVGRRAVTIAHGQIVEAG